MDDNIFLDKLLSENQLQCCNNPNCFMEKDSQNTRKRVIGKN